MIREYRASDWNEVCRVFDLAKPRELATAGVEASFVPLADDVNRHASFRKSTLLVWHDAGKVDGFAGYDGSYIGWLFVDPAMFRRGIARALLRAILERIEGEPWLWSMKHNAAAIALYRSEGFAIVEERETQNGGLPCSAVKLSRRRS
jgi:ribosomal protein S18 acetylase RimI-like enzyme